VKGKDVLRQASYAGLILLSLLGCQSYRQAPINLEAYETSWLSRNLKAPEIADFSKELTPVGEEATLAFDPSDGVSLKEAEKIALAYNPSLRAARLDAKVPLAVAGQVGRWDDPEVEFLVGRVLDKDEDDQRLEGTLGIPVPVSGRLGAAKSKALAEYSADEAGVRASEWALLNELRDHWLEWSNVQANVELTEEYIAQIDKIILIADRLKEAGELRRTDARLFTIERAVQTTELESQRYTARGLKLEIKRVMGLAPEAVVDFSPTLDIKAAPLSSSERRRMLEKNNPDLAWKRAEYAFAERSLVLENRKQYPDVNVGVMYERAGSEEALLVGPGLPLPLWNANRAGVAEAGASRTAARAEFEAVYIRLASNLARAEVRLQRAVFKRENLEREVIPLVREQIQEIKALAALGEFDSLLLLEAITRAIDTRRDILEARLEESQASNQVNYLLGPLSISEPLAGKE